MSGERQQEEFVTVRVIGVNEPAATALAQALTLFVEQAAGSPAPSSNGNGEAVYITCRGQNHPIYVEPFRQKLKGKGIDLSSDLAIRAIKERRHFDNVKDNEKGGADAEDFIFRDIIKNGPFRGDTA